MMPKSQKLMRLIICFTFFYAIFRAISRSHGVESTLAWIFAIIAFAGFGAIAYIVFENPNMKSTTRRKRLSMDAVRNSIKANIPMFSTQEQGAVFHLSSSISGLLPTKGNLQNFLRKTSMPLNRLNKRLTKPNISSGQNII